jgi:dTDP-4-dehydrorhamnose reductase
MILIFGGTGMLGHKLFQHFLPRFPGTICTMHRRASDAPYSRIAMFQSPQVIEGIDVFDFNKLSHLLLRLKPDFIVNCIGSHFHHYCELPASAPVGRTMC